MRIGIPVGLRYMAYGAFWFSVMAMLVKVAGRRLDSNQIVLVRAALTCAFSYALVRRARISPWGNHRTLLVVRAVLGFAALTCFYFSVVHLPLAEATVIQYSQAVFAAIFAVFLLGEHFGARDAAGVLVSAIGVVVLARPSFLFGQEVLNSTHVLIALAGAALSGAAYVSVRMLRHADHHLVVVFYFAAISVPLALPFAYRSWVQPTPLEWLILLGVGITTQAGQVYITRGLQLEPAGRATAVGYLQVVFAMFWSTAIFAQRPDVLALVGAAIVMAGTLLVALRSVPEVE